MEILTIHFLKGPNYWSIHHKIAEVILDIGNYEELPTNKIDGFCEGLIQLLPGLAEHYCSLGKPGGFLERVISGTWIGHVVEHIAIELQLMTGMKSGFGRTLKTDEKGIYRIVIEFELERGATYAINAAVQITEALSKGSTYDLKPDLAELKKIAAEDKLGPSTQALVDSALKRNIPVSRLNPGSLVQLGYGIAQKRIEATTTENTSNIAVELACDKQKTKTLLKTSGIPVPEGYLIREISELQPAISEMDFPVVIKPNNANQGKGVTLAIDSFDQAVAAFAKAKSWSDDILIERYFPGNDYRLLMVNYKFVAAAQRTPAMVTGDGLLTVRDLIEIANLDPTRGEDHENILTRIQIDQTTQDYLKLQDITLDYVPPAGIGIFLKQTANLSTGGTSEDVTDLVNPEVIALAERAARIIGLDICGIDYISNDITRSYQNQNGVVLEVNAAPGFRMHTHPLKGKPRNVGDAVMEMLFPDNNGRIPLIAVTGTNGKTTTTRLIAHIAKTAGYNVGFTTTDGIYIGGELIEEGDCTGPLSTEKVLRDKSINFAVLECARGGILRSGLAFDQCDIGIVTNVEDDHLGLNGIDTLEEMAKVKSIIPELVKPDGVAILNADNPFTFKMKSRLKCKVAYFSTKLNNNVVEHCTSGGIAALYKDGNILLLKGSTIFFIESVETIPLAFGGKATFMIENILAATLAAWMKGIDIELIRKALHTFIPNFDNIPGRMNLFRFKEFSFLLDYAHNFHGIKALGSWLMQENSTLKTGIITCPGDRRDIDLINVGRASAEIFDQIIIRVDEDTRGRNEKEIIGLLYSGIRDVNKNLPVEVIRSEIEAVETALRKAVPGSLIVNFSDKIKKSFAVIKNYQQKEMTMVLKEKMGHRRSLIGRR